jgi:thiaminase/transcriptional activator TenA
MPNAVTSASAWLRDCSEPEWSALADEPFVRELASGELAPERFRFYIEQNLQYLPQYARVMALGAAKSRDERELGIFAAGLRQVVDVELPENRALLERVVDAGAPDRGGAREAAPANLAYTSWLLALAFSGGPVEILAAVLPCTWSYGAIGRQLGGGAADHPVYRPWLSFFGSDEYQGVVERVRRDLDDLAGAADEAQRDRLADTFRTGVRFEHGFWQMAYTLQGWGGAAGAATLRANTRT